MTMQTGDIGQLRQDAVEKIIFHATPKKWLVIFTPLAVSVLGSLASLRSSVPAAA
jgi:hypothetical protein